MNVPAPRIALVTGGGSGIGAAVARGLAADGWTVVIAGRRASALDDVVASAGSEMPGEIVAMPADVTDEASVGALFSGILQRFTRLDLLFNNAGRGAPSDGIGHLSLEDWNAVVAVNLTGTFLCTREAFRMMREQSPQGGRIINNGSISAHAPRPNSIAYTATKHAITGMTKSTALDGRAFDIACGQIDIGNADTAMTGGIASGVPQADGALMAEPLMPLSSVADAVRYMAGLPLDANVATMTVMATKMPMVGRG